MIPTAAMRNAENMRSNFARNLISDRAFFSQMILPKFSPGCVNINENPWKYNKTQLKIVHVCVGTNLKAVHNLIHLIHT